MPYRDSDYFRAQIDGNMCRYVFILNFFTLIRILLNCPECHEYAHDKGTIPPALWSTNIVGIILEYLTLK
ncbi:unnamed protein product [Arctia plantaginis]|uniref:Uncharacterized protein n=1 Tax=Arctia plantaginis TaxID=874455 RepID=A0A8S1AXJ8_ARCPL|nr:unnamed protein product [Arctia plantaginis]